MSGRELAADGTDSYHPEYPWEQAGHPLYLQPTQRTRFNWPPEPAYPAGPHEAAAWDALPERLNPQPSWRREYRPIERRRVGIRCGLGIHSYPRHVDAYTQAPAPIRCERCGKPR